MEHERVAGAHAELGQHPQRRGVVVVHAGDDLRQAERIEREQQHGIRRLDGEPYRLIPLPWPRPCFDPVDGHRLPATYANFLIINGAVLVPVYGDAADTRALTALAGAFPDRDIVPIDCLSVIRQHGSLHCLTMQLPAGSLAQPNIP